MTRLPIGSAVLRRRAPGWLAASFLVLFLLTVSVAAAASRGELDPSFGVGGQKTLVPGFPAAQIEDLAVQPDGKVVLVGLTSVFPRDASDFLLIRLNEDGSPDTSFSGDGIQTTDFAGFGDGAASVALAPGGEIVVAGFASTAAGTGNADHAVARYDDEGELDSSFAGDGKQTIDYGSGSEGASAVAIQEDGKVVVAGGANPSGIVVDFGVARLEPNGDPDPSFSGDGRTNTDFGGTQDSVRSLAIQEDGKIVALGYTDTGLAIYDFALARYDDEGELDPSFAGDGKQTTSFAPDSFDEPYGLAIAADGRILAAGFSGDEVAGYEFAIARYDDEGELDPQFSADGLQKAGFEPSGEANELIPPRSLGIAGLELAADGTAFVSGSTAFYDQSFEEHSEIAVAAFAPDGSLDPGFSGDGRLAVSFAAGNSRANASGLDADGRLVLAGSVSAAGGLELALARLYGLAPKAPGPATGSDAALNTPEAPRPSTSVACRRAKAGLTAARKRVAVAGRRVTASKRRLSAADGKTRRVAVGRTVRRAEIRFENAKEQRDRAAAKVAARCGRE